MPNSQNEVEQIADAMAPPPEPRFTLKNISPDPLRFVLLEDGYLQNDDTFVNVPSVEMTTDPVTGKQVPKNYGPPNAPPEKRLHRQVRERRIDIAPGKSISIPLRFLPAIIRVRCDVCATGPGGDNARGRCRFPLDSAHRETWQIMGAALCSPTQVSIDVLKDVPVDTSFRTGLEDNAKATRSNKWGRKVHMGDT